MKRILALSVAMTACTAFAQTFNVDFNASSGAGAGAPSNAYKAAAGYAGVWNAVGSSSAVSLVDVSGAATGVTLTRTGQGVIVNNSSGALSGDDEKLLEDAFRGNIGVTVTYSFNNLSAGTYALYTYAINPSSPATSIVNAAGSTSMSDQAVGTIMAGPGYFVGATHGLHVRSISAGGSFSVSIAPAGDGNCTVAGLQLVKLTTPRLRVFVKSNAAGAGTGATWTDAFTSLQTALSTSRYSGGANTEIWVANGTYRPTTGTDRSAAFRIPNNLHMYGGFAGTETDVSQRGFQLCYLNGNIGNGSSKFDNSYTVVIADLTDPGTLIDGFRIHNGYNDNTQTLDGGHGAGMRLQGGSATIRNCTFVANESLGEGGGLFCDFGSPTLVDCLFYNNTAYAGSAVFHSDIHPIRMYNCDFMGNSGYEGTIRLDNSDAMIANCFIHGNYTGGEGGAVHAAGSGSQSTIVNCTIVGNSSGTYVGGVIASNGATVDIRNSIFWQNTDQYSLTVLKKQYDTIGFGSTINVAATTAQGAGGNPGLDPLFVNGPGADGVWGTFDDNCRLQPNSPAVNGGGNAHVPADLGDLDLDGNTAEQLPVDFDGNHRIVDVVVDRGAFELQSADCPADLNGDGAVNQADLALLLSCYNAGSCGDIDGDNDTDQADLAALLAQYGTACQ